MTEISGTLSSIALDSTCNKVGQLTSASYKRKLLRLAALYELSFLSASFTTTFFYKYNKYAVMVKAIRFRGQYVLK
jgi:E3 ubiquitin-protein ligase DOA10